MEMDLAEKYEKKYFEKRCRYEIRQELKCDEYFYQKTDGASLYEEYCLRCKSCENFYQNCGLYFSSGEYTDDFEKQVAAAAVHLKNQKELEEFVGRCSPRLKAVYLGGRFEDLTCLEKFYDLEMAYLYPPRVKKLWNMKKTPSFQCLEIEGGKNITDLSGLSEARALRYFQISPITSQINPNRVESFAPLACLPELEEVVLSGTIPLDGEISPFISLPKLKRMWVSPNLFSVQEYARFEALKFLFDEDEEYGIF
ncbi:MAG: hypothetical protein KH054_05885, partial [Firmicutes bacterium]|nr:hypothetical protein [Bacillota bacterium]